MGVILNKSFSEVKEIQFRPVYHDRFKFIDEEFDTNLSSWTITRNTVNSVSVSNGKLVVDGSSGGTLYMYHNVQPKIPFLVIRVKVDRMDSKWLAFGLYTSDESNGFGVSYDRSDPSTNTPTLKIEKRVNGSTSTIAYITLNNELTTPFEIWMTLSGTIIGLWVNGELKLKAYYGDETIIQKSNFATYYVMLKMEFVSTDYVGTNEIDFVKAYHGVFLGVRDHKFVKTKNGDTWDYLKIDNKYVVSASVGGISEDENGNTKQFVGTFNALFLFDPETLTLEPYSIIVFDDGTYLRGDSPNGIIFDPDNNIYRIVVSYQALRYLQGIESTKIVYAETTSVDNDDHVIIATLDMSKTVPVDTGYVNYDPDIIWYNGKYYIANVKNKADWSEHYIELWSTVDFQNYSLEWRIATTNEEGCQFFFDVDGQKYILTGDSNGDVRVYSFENVELLGIIDIPRTDPRPHPATVIYNNKYYMFGFDRDEYPNAGAYSHGDTHVYSAEIGALFRITSYPSQVNGSPNESKTISITVENQGMGDGTVDLRILDENNSVVVSQQQTISAGSSYAFDLTITLPSTVGTYTWSIEAYNVDTSNVDDTKTFTVEVLSKPAKKSEFPWWILLLIGIGAVMYLSGKEKNR